MLAYDIYSIIREEYLYDVSEPFRWSDSFIYRSLIEAERQACNRWNYIFDASTANICTIPLLHGVQTYPISLLITAVKYASVTIAGTTTEATKKTAAEQNYSFPLWRSDAGMKGKPISYTIRGRTLSVVSIPNGATDATYIQATQPGTGAQGNTWWNTTTGVLSWFNAGLWEINDLAPLGTINLEVYRLPTASTIVGTYTPEIPEEYQKSLIYWVMFEACMKKDSDGDDAGSFDPKRAEQFLQGFNQVFGTPVNAAVRQAQLEGSGRLSFTPQSYTTSLTRTSSRKWDSD